MKVEGGRRSSNVDDRRGRGRAPLGIGIGAVLIAVVVVLLGGDPQTVLQALSEAQPEPTSSGAPDPAQDELADFITIVLGDTEDVWSTLFAASNSRYPAPTLVLFTDKVSSACGFQSAAVGPFYCPADQKIYIDLGFYDELGRKYGAPGDFAQAYVLAHEVGHHVQNVVGTSTKVHQAKQGLSEEAANALSVKLELQADCYSGVWAHHAHKARSVLEAGDVEEGLQAASAIGDDRLQQQAQGFVVPESFTHGTSAERARWFTTGLESGDVGACDTF